ncbi:hypothetical protein M2189_007050 [Bradyrhizobium japonicum]|uniref:hypothetical protein n=1 Tax=Bradyrhizobium japonicum TaxID=375 RepID=UPI00216A3E67|nr:hypothetical protein [Bradyrhizobium japonicum]MCS3503434.1 hypothetical protein [Bradyrhizobium japonicum]MCS3963847.1 hypothetical protein [Bradyrhizobium japonicum]MCS3996160.1 hypothetical protein [Bradyrhizobium japonicum]
MSTQKKAPPSGMQTASPCSIFNLKAIYSVVLRSRVHAARHCDFHAVIGGERRVNTAMDGNDTA